MRSFKHQYTIKNKQTHTNTSTHVYTHSKSIPPFKPIIQWLSPDWVLLRSHEWVCVCHVWLCIDGGKGVERKRLCFYVNGKKIYIWKWEKFSGRAPEDMRKKNKPQEKKKSKESKKAGGERQDELSSGSGWAMWWGLFLFVADLYFLSRHLDVPTVEIRLFIAAKQFNLSKGMLKMIIFNSVIK